MLWAEVVMGDGGGKKDVEVLDKFYIIGSV
jgi:hypothetical protein